jgi:hypothetical protein
MKHRVPAIIEAVTPVVAMLIIWRLVAAAMAAGQDGVMFFGGVAAVAGLGGYEVKSIIDKRNKKKSSG